MVRKKYLKQLNLISCYPMYCKIEDGAFLMCKVKYCVDLYE